MVAIDRRDVQPGDPGRRKSPSAEDPQTDGRGERALSVVPGDSCAMARVVGVANSAGRCTNGCRRLLRGCWVEPGTPRPFAMGPPRPSIRLGILTPRFGCLMWWWEVPPSRIIAVVVWALACQAGWA